MRADQAVPYGTVMEVMGKIRGAGITDVGLVTLSANGANQDGTGPSLPTHEEN